MEKHMCPIPSSAEVVAIQEGGHHGNRIFCGWHVELPISYLLENNDFECMKHLDQGFRFPFLKIRVTNTEFRRRAVPGMGPSTSDNGSVSEVSLNFDKIHQIYFSDGLFYLRFFFSAVITEHQRHLVYVQPKRRESERVRSKQRNCCQTSGRTSSQKDSSYQTNAGTNKKT